LNTLTAQPWRRLSDFTVVRLPAHRFHTCGAALIPKGKKEIIIMFEWDREVDSLVFWPIMLTVNSTMDPPPNWPAGVRPISQEGMALFGIDPTTNKLSGTVGRLSSVTVYG
jgi:hypothetical protein